MTKPPHRRIQRVERHLYCPSPSGGGGYDAWSVGANVLYVLQQLTVRTQIGAVEERCPSMSVECALRVGAQTHPVTALLDTGAAWSLLSAQFAAEIGLDPDAGDLLDKPIKHGDNAIKGVIQHVDLILRAGQGSAQEAWGQDLNVPARFVISSNWVAPRVVLGVNGCLELLRVGVEVNTTRDQVPRWYFGRAV